MGRGPAALRAVDRAVPVRGDEHCAGLPRDLPGADHAGGLRTEYFHYDLIALLLALVAIPTSFMGVFIAPIAIFLGFRYWKAPWRPVPYRKWTMVLAMLLASLALVGWISFFVFAMAAPEFQ